VLKMKMRQRQMCNWIQVDCDVSFSEEGQGAAAVRAQK